MAKFATNNKKYFFIKLFQFFTLKDLHLNISFYIIHFLNITIFDQINKQKIINIFSKFIQKSIIKI